MPARNVESHFSRLPWANVKRTKMKYNFDHKLTFNAGQLVPFMVEEVLPGDTLQIDTNSFTRLSPSIHPTMDNLYMDTYYFFVPNRLIWDDWIKFMGENDKPWAQDTSQFVPPYVELEVKDGLVAHGSILNYLGVPTLEGLASKPNTKVKATILDFNAYCKVWNDWFRDENLSGECPIYTGNGKIPSDYVNAYASFLDDIEDNEVTFIEGGSLLPVAKFHDYFTSSLPQPQKGADVLIPASGNVTLNSLGDGEQWKAGVLRKTDNSQIGSSNEEIPLSLRVDSYSDPYYNAANIVDTDYYNQYVYDPQGSLGFKDLQITINSLRLAFQTQRLLELDARGGTRYTELLQSHFGVVSPDARLQRSEYLGGQRISLNMSQVVQQSETTASSPLGNLAGLSATGARAGSFTKSFTEHGYVIGVCCVRPDRTYSQGLPRRYSRFNRLDYYFPVLANIGEQPILNKEIFAASYDTLNSKDMNDEVFGYQEAWAEYRYQNNRCSGLLAPSANNTLVAWTYQDDYTSMPYLSSPWLYQGDAEVNRTLVFQNQDQLMADFYLTGSFTRPMPLYSIPGLIDHN